LRNLPHDLDVYLVIDLLMKMKIVHDLVNVQTMRKILQIFVAFLEKLNFTIWVASSLHFLLHPNLALVINTFNFTSGIFSKFILLVPY
jgi:hypothetical protein